MKKIFLIILATNLFLNSQGIVIKKGSKEEKVKPLNNNEIKVVSQKKSIRAGWTVDDSDESKKNRLKGIQNSSAGNNCH